LTNAGAHTPSTGQYQPQTPNFPASTLGSQKPRSRQWQSNLQDWSKDNNWATPPIALILHILNLVETVQIWSHTRAPAQQALEVGSLQDLWLPNPAGWSSAVANLLNNALAASTWKLYTSNLCQFKVYCLTNNIPFPPEQDKAIGAVTSFLELATRSSQQPLSMIASLSAAIGALYETTHFHPTCDPLLS